MLKMYSKRSRFQTFSGGGGGVGACDWTNLETGVSFFLVTHDYIRSNQKSKKTNSLLACEHIQFSLLMAAWGHFARRNFCDSATKNSIMIM